MYSLEFIDLETVKNMPIGSSERLCIERLRWRIWKRKDPVFLSSQKRLKKSENTGIF
jgi:hypothetical protein